jgi:hypothetical protein
MKQVIPEIRDLNKLIRYRNRHSVAPFSFAPSVPKFPSLDFVHITPDPRLPRLIGTDERVLRFVEVFGGVLVLGRVATAHVSTGEAQAQVNPGVTRLNAVLTDMLICFFNFDLV